MIQVHKPTSPPVLLSRGVAETKKLCADYAAAPDEFRAGTQKRKFKKSIYAHRTVKSALMTAQHHKCAFCESFISHISYGDVEHFRPKAGYKQHEDDELQRPGYYWLAYSWDNLLFVCQLCNEERKGNMFPLRKPLARARIHSDDIDAEEPLLIDPSRLDPAGYIQFREQYAVPVRHRREGKTTIEVLGLNREKLAEVRAERLQNLKVLHRLCGYLRREIAQSPSPELIEQLRLHEGILRAHADDRNAYAAMARAFLAAVRTT